MKIYFIRHGESEANRLKVISNRPGQHPLTATGRQQAATLAARLKSRVNPAFPTRIYSSPLLRAMETARIIGASLSAPVEATDALREYDLGVMEGRSDAHAWQAWHWLRQEWFEHGRHDQKMEGGESYNEIKDRFSDFIQIILDTYRNLAVTIICVSHGGLYTALLPQVLANLDATYTHRSIEHTDMIIAEDRPGGLVCLEWCGQPLDY